MPLCPAICVFECVCARKAMPEIDKIAWKMIEIWKADKLNLYYTTCKLMICIEISWTKGGKCNSIMWSVSAFAM